MLGLARKQRTVTGPAMAGLIDTLNFCLVPTPVPFHVETESVVSAAGVDLGITLVELNVPCAVGVPPSSGLDTSIQNSSFSSVTPDAT